MSTISSECPLNQMYALARNLTLLNQHETYRVSEAGGQWLLGLVREQLDPEMRKNFDGTVYKLSPNRVDEWGWGERHAFDDLNIVIKAIEEIALEKFNAVPPSSKNALFGSIYDLAGKPNTSDNQWGEHNATQDTERLIRALHTQGQIQDNHPAYFENYERAVHTHSQTYHLNRREPEHVRIGYVNGMGTSYDTAFSDSCRFSDNLLTGYNLHSVHAATSNDVPTDMAEVLLQMSGTLTTPVRLIHETWNDFFNNAKNDQLFLQFCHSKGAIHVRKALESFPDENLRKRIVVFAIAPAILMPKDSCREAYHYVIPGDIAPYLLTNFIPEMKQRIDNKESDIVILQNHADNSHIHDPHGSSYQEQVKKDLQKYLN